MHHLKTQSPSTHPGCGGAKMPEKITAKTLAKTIKKAKETNASIYLWDTELRGFGLYASPSRDGHCAWLAQKWVGGKLGRNKRIAFDHYPNLEIDDARKKAATIIAELANGVDVLARK